MIFKICWTADIYAGGLSPPVLTSAPTNSRQQRKCTVYWSDNCGLFMLTRNQLFLFVLYTTCIALLGIVRHTVSVI